MSESENNNNTTEKPSLWQVTWAVMASAFGVQSSKNRQKDFETKTATPFIIGGLIFTVVFCAAVYAVVALVLPD